MLYKGMWAINKEKFWVAILDFEKSIWQVYILLQQNILCLFSELLTPLKP